MGGGAKTTTKTNEKSEQQVQLPAWMTEAGQGLFNQASAQAAANPAVRYTGAMTPSMAANQTAAGNVAAQAPAGAQDLNMARAATMAAANGPAPMVQNNNTQAATMGAAQSNATGMTAAQAGATGMRAASAGATGYNAATQAPQAQNVTAQQVGTGEFDGAAAQKYMTPYNANVQQNVLAEMRRQNSMENDSLGDSAQAARAYGGTRHAVLESETRGRQNNNMMDYLDASNQAAFTNAQGQFNADRQAGMTVDLANQGANLQADTFTASLLDQLMGRNTASLNDAGRFNAGAMNAAAQSNADRSQAASGFNAGAMNTAAQANADRSQSAAGFNAGAMNSASESNADRAQSAYGFNAGAINDATQADAGRNLAASSTNAQLSQSMLDRMLSAGGQFANIGNQAAGQTSQQITDLLRTGAVEQATQGDQQSADYQEFLRMQNAPMEKYQNLMAILSGTPRNVTTSGTSSGTSVQKTSPGLLNTLLGAGQIAASFASDPALKKDMVRIGETSTGLGIYNFRYIWDDDDAPLSIGVSADEVEELMPEALGPEFMGRKTVDYAMIGGAAW